MPCLLYTSNSFCLDLEGYAFLVARVFAIVAPTTNLYFLLAILNSRVVEFYLHQVCPPKQGGYYSYNAGFLDQIPIPIIGFSKGMSRRNKVLRSAKKLYSNEDTNSLDLLLSLAISEVNTHYTDTVHDILAYLSEQMVVMHKEVHALVANFWRCV